VAHRQPLRVITQIFPLYSGGPATDRASSEHLQSADLRAVAYRADR
jgi:hypothetical protein